MTLSSSRNCLVKEHLQGIRDGIKNWPGLVSRYKFYELNDLSRLLSFIKSSIASANFLYARRQNYSAGQLRVAV